MTIAALPGRGFLSTIRLVLILCWHWYHIKLSFKDCFSEGSRGSVKWVHFVLERRAPGSSQSPADLSLGGVPGSPVQAMRRHSSTAFSLC